MKPSLDIIIVNWNAGAQLFKCLASISPRLEEVCLQRVVVVDNNSSDGSLAHIETLALPLTVLRNEENRGFGAACNQGACGSHSDYLLFLNPDTEVSACALDLSIAFMEQVSNDRVGICGIQLVDANNHISQTCSRFPRPAHFYEKMLGMDRLFPNRFPGTCMTEWDHCEDRLVDQVMGAFFLVRRGIFEELDGFDERFFVYFEEVDFSIRARQHGWKTAFLAGARALHKGCGTSDQAKASRLFYSLRSRIRYAFKHFPLPSAVMLAVGTLVIEPVSRLLIAIITKSPQTVRETLLGYARLWASLAGSRGRSLRSTG